MCPARSSMRPDRSPPRHHGGLTTTLPEPAAELVKAYKPYPAIYRTDLMDRLGRRRRQVPHRSPDATIEVVLDDLTAGGVHAHFGTSIEGCSLRATDPDWSYGSGPAMNGPAGYLALVLCGRTIPEARPEGNPL
jgi:hypothetical protein